MLVIVSPAKQSFYEHHIKSNSLPSSHNNDCFFPFLAILNIKTDYFLHTYALTHLHTINEEELLCLVKA
jgi:hypothetical protein